MKHLELKSTDTAHTHGRCKPNSVRMGENIFMAFYKKSWEHITVKFCRQIILTLKNCNIKKLSKKSQHKNRKNIKKIRAYLQAWCFTQSCCGKGRFGVLNQEIREDFSNTSGWSFVSVVTKTNFFHLISNFFLSGAYLNSYCSRN